MASSDEEIAASTEDLLSIQPKEDAAVESVGSGTIALQEQVEDLLEKLTGYGVASAETVDAFIETMDEIMDNIEDYLSLIAGVSNSDTPTWLAPYCMLQYGYTPTGVDDLGYTGPIPAAGLSIFANQITVNANINSGGQFPSSETINGGPDDDIPMSIMVRKATLTKEQFEALPPTAPATPYGEIRSRAFDSSLGTWAIHYPWNGIVVGFTKDPNTGRFTELTTAKSLTNAPSLDFGKIEDDSQGKISGIGWGGAFGVYNDPFTITDHYIDTVLKDCELVFYDRTTDITYEGIAVSAVSLTGPGTDIITFSIDLPGNYFGGRDVSQDGFGKMAFLCLDKNTGEGKYDTIFGFTSLLSWSCFEKNTDGTWQNLINDIDLGGSLGREVGYEGSGLFLNSQAGDLDGDTVPNDHARDILYNLNINKDTLKDRRLYKANQLQGIYSGQIKDLAASATAWIKQWDSTNAALEASLESSLIYKGEASFNATEEPIKPIERYLSLVRSFYTGISMKVPVETLQDGEAKDGIRMTLVTGAMYRSDKGVK